jgi:hypothetical protein
MCGPRPGGRGEKKFPLGFNILLTQGRASGPDRREQEGPPGKNSYHGAPTPAQGSARPSLLILIPGYKSRQRPPPGPPRYARGALRDLNIDFFTQSGPLAALGAPPSKRGPKGIIKIPS